VQDFYTFNGSVVFASVVKSEINAFAPMEHYANKRGGGLSMIWFPIQRFKEVLPYG
jgi:hypothetical protein